MHSCDVYKDSIRPTLVLFCLSFDLLSGSYVDCLSLIFLQEEHGHIQKALLLLTVQQLLPGALMEIILRLRLLVFLLLHLLPPQLYLVHYQFYSKLCMFTTSSSLIVDYCESICYCYLHSID